MEKVLEAFDNKEMSRRTFVKNSLLVAGALTLAPSIGAVEEKTKVMTVTGEITAEKMGFTLTHEHVMSIFGGAPAKVAQYDEEKLFARVIPYLKMLKTFGVETICDCTAAYFGRRADLLKKISEESGVQILTNTGYYGAANDRYVPDHVHQETAEQIAVRWIDEWKNGIDGTGIRPGFIKIGVDEGLKSDVDKKLIRAAGLTHLETGLTIASHTSRSTDAAVEQVTILTEMGVDPSAWIWVHAHNVEDVADLQPIANAGAWISLDGIRKETLDKHINALRYLRRFGVLHRVLLSHDGNSFRYGDRPFKAYDAIVHEFIPLMKKANFRDEEITRFLVENPREAFGVKVRRIVVEEE